MSVPGPTSLPPASPRTARPSVGFWPLTWPTRRPALAAALAAALTLAALLPLAVLPALTARPGLRVDNGMEVWLDRESAEAERYDELLRRFGSEETVLAIYDMPGPDDLPRLAELRGRLEAIPGVRRVQDLSDVRERFYATADDETFLRTVRDSPLYRGLLVSADGSLAATRILLTGEPDRAALVAAVRQAAAATLPSQDVRLAGPPVLNVALDEASRRAARTFFPWVFVLSGLVLWLLFRSLGAVLIPFLSVGAGLAWTLALLAVSGHTLDMVTVALPPVLWVLGLSTSIHLLAGSRHRSVTAAVDDLAGPCFASAVTTALGFASLVFASMEPVRTMGLFGGLGVLLCLLANFLLFPWLAGRFRRLRRTPIPRLPDDPSRRWAQRWIDGLGRRTGTVLAISAVLALVLGVSMARLEADSNVVSFLRDDTEVATTYREVLPRLTSPYSLEVLLDTGPDPTPEDLRRVDRLAAGLGDRPGVVRVVSPLDLVKAVDQTFRERPAESFQLPADDGDLRTVWDLTGSLLADERRLLFDPEGGVLRLSVLARPMGSAAYRELVDELRSELRRQAPDRWHPRLTGVVDLLVGMQERLLASQVRSFAAAFLWIVPVLAVLLRSVRDALLSLAPNLFPIVVALGALGLAGRPLDPATMMVAGVAFGIAVDDTIHVLAAYRRARRGLAPKAARVQALAAVGSPVVTTSVVAALGFAVLTLSDFTPLLRFGVLTSITLAAALFGDLVLLPALLEVADREPAAEPRELEETPA